MVSFTARVEIDSPDEQGLLLNGAEVSASQVSPSTMELSISGHQHFVSYLYPVLGARYKFNVARKSHYIEFSDGEHDVLDSTPEVKSAAPAPTNIKDLIRTLVTLSSGIQGGKARAISLANRVKMMFMRFF
ncbi:hypothetical protein FRC10_005641 [Ceratobasidium sp. 414]|nr:hypothetical protein FRC10_005641 [Ceratobasidium sp. 414]